MALAGGFVTSCGKTQAKAKAKVYPVAGVVLEAPGRFDTRPQAADCWIPGAPGASIMYGDAARNPTGGGLVMALAAGGSVRASELSDFRISKDTAGLVALEIDRGEVWVDTAGRGATVKTPAVTITRPGDKEKGSGWLIGTKVAPGGSTTVTSYEGTAQLVGAGLTRTLSAGYQCTCEPGKAPSQPVKTDATAPKGGLAFLIRLQSVPYFRNPATRDQTEDDARSKLAVDQTDAWSYVNLGRALIDAGDVPGAKAAFNRAVENKPGFSQALAGLGRAALEEGRWGEAANAYEQARLADKTSLEAMLGVANSALGTGDTDQAEKAYKDTLDADSENFMALTGLGTIELLRGESESARSDLDQALKLQPSDAAACELLSFDSALSGNLQQSVSYLKQAIDADPKDLRSRYALADRYLRMGETDLALVAFKHITQSDDRGTMALGYQGTGAIAQGKGDVKGALTAWTKCQELVPDRPVVLEDLGGAHMLVGESEAAIAALSRAAAVDINDWLAHQMLARAYMAAGAGAQAVQEARNAVTLAPGEWSAHLVLGLALEATGASAEGAAEVSRALALKPKEKMSAADHAMFASALQRAGKPDQALVEYRSAALLDPSNASYRRLAGDVLTAMKRNGEALVEYQKAVRIDPTDSLVQADLASALYATGKKADAIDILQKAVEKDPNNPAIRRVLGEYLLADNDLEGALFQLDAAATLPGVEPSLLASILIDRGNARDRKEDFAGAIADYARAISTDPSRGDAWFYLAGDLERTNKPVDARAAYTNAVTLCKARPEWQKFADEANAKLAKTQ